MPTTIESWSTYRDPYTAPELPPRIQGRLPDGRHILTSCIARSDGRTIHTENGSTYELGKPDPKFLRWLASHDYQFDPENPIRLVKKPTQLPPPRRRARRRQR